MFRRGCSLERCWMHRGDCPACQMQRHCQYCWLGVGAEGPFVLESIAASVQPATKEVTLAGVCCATVSLCMLTWQLSPWAWLGWLQDQPIHTTTCLVTTCTPVPCSRAKVWLLLRLLTRCAVNSSAEAMSAFISGAVSSTCPAAGLLPTWVNGLGRGGCGERGWRMHGDGALVESAAVLLFCL